MNNINISIIKAIKEGKWLLIKYVNSKEETSTFWAAIKGVDNQNQSFIVDMFNNSYLSNDNRGLYQDTIIYYKGILSAEVINGTKYDVPPSLIDAITNKEVDWLDGDFYDDNILNYLEDCLFYDQTPYQRESTLIDGIEEETFKDGVINLDLFQIAQISKGLENCIIDDSESVFNVTELAFNLLSIKTKKGLFVIAYKKVLFDVANSKLTIDNEIHFNYLFTSNSEGRESVHSLRNYLDVDVDYFTELYINNPDEAKKLFDDVTHRKGEAFDERPYLMDMVRQFSNNTKNEYNSIRNHHAIGDLSAPLDAFFGNMSLNRLGKKDNYEIVTLDNNLNIDQLRVIHNALKNPITYVQGPPGTGKTQSIINLLVSLLSNKQTALLCSNNNKPIDDVLYKIQSQTLNNKRIPFPMLRIGNPQTTLKSLQWLKTTLHKYKNDFERVDTEKLEKHININVNNYKEINTLIGHYEEKMELEEQWEILHEMYESNSNEMTKLKLKVDCDEIDRKIRNSPTLSNKDFLNKIRSNDHQFKMWLYFTSLSYLKKLSEPKFSTFRAILENDDPNEQVRTFNKYIKDNDNLRQLLTVFPIIASTNQSAPKLGTPRIHFDMTIIDEAGQSSIATALFPIIRGKKLVLVGDQNQLQPVLTIDPQTNEQLMTKYAINSEYNYLHNSILKLMTTKDTISKFILLRFHYRCRPQIIQFSNKKYYGGNLRIETQDNGSSLAHIPAKEPSSFRPNTRNVARTEALKIIQHIKENKLTNVGIITPFRNQAALITEQLELSGFKNGEVSVGTIHTYQGDEKDTIYFSAAVTPFTYDKTLDWLSENNELINVATTRAKEQLIVVGDFEEIKKRTPENSSLSELFKYVVSNGKNIQISEAKGRIIANSMNNRQYNTEAEKELLITIGHFLTINRRYTVRTQIRVSDLLTKYIEPSLFEFGKNSTFDFVLYENSMADEFPVLIIELDGPEHYNDPLVMRRDAKKEEICKAHNIKLLRIKNDYSRRYVFVKKQIIKWLKDN